LHEVPHRVIEVDPPRIDLAADGEAARRHEHTHLCFLNSYAEVLVDGWLGHLARALAQPGVAMAGATGSWESLSDWRRGTPAHNLYDLVRLPWLRRLYPRFPNPHLRTSTFLAARERLGALGLERVRDKPSAYRLESGVSGIIPQLRAAGERAVVVDRDGIAHEEEDWPASRTFRSGDQERLLVADNQTRLYDAASPQERRRLSANAWGQAR
ncbi:MAG TPA: hypothetical protein VG186_14705, partial [Solirubrobacteraceae bacterium]|nr:hypothetical protein [Solirubrobacteraceae bacterium]